MPSIYSINPRVAFPGYYTGEAFTDGDEHWVQVADLTTPTIAAMVPEGWDIVLADETITPVDLDLPVDFVALTGKVTQRARVIELAREFRRRGRVVLIGGSFATLTPHDMRPHADILVTGEIEELAPRLFADLAAGVWHDRYDGGMADIQLSPLPRWDLYRVDRAMEGALQTTRGCPFNCEFCDVIQYQGRKQRHKSVEQVLAELDHLYRHGFRKIFIVDDNFTVHRKWAHAVLDAFIEWGKKHADDPVSFSTQASLDIARDDELLAKCVAARLRTLFVGVETINEDSLRETGKRQNLLLPVLDAVRRIVARGVTVYAGIIVGFDHDDSSVFDRLDEFFQASPLPALNIGALTAPYATDLYRRLLKEGRLSGDVWQTSASNPFATNIVPAKMSRDELLERVAGLCRGAYAPRQFEQRVLNFIELYDPASREIEAQNRGTETGKAFSRIVRAISDRGPAEAAMVRKLLRAATRKPVTLQPVIVFLCLYAQTRLLLDSACAMAPADAA
jgi:hypothetical protein